MWGYLLHVGSSPICDASNDLSCSKLAGPNKPLFACGHLTPVVLNLDGDCKDQSHPTDVSLRRYQGQRQSHAAILTRFEADLQDISGIALHPVARTDKLKRLSDLVPVTKLRKWAAHCQEGHDKFIVKVPPVTFIVSSTGMHLDSALDVSNMHSYVADMFQTCTIRRQIHMFAQLAAAPVL